MQWLSSRLAYGSPRGHRVQVGSGSELEVGVLVEKRNFAAIAGEFARDYFGKRHEAGLRVGRHGEAVLEGPSDVSSADPGTEDQGVTAVEGDGRLDVDRSRQVRHMISGESPYLARQLSVF
jgi:hypothetical protein